MAEEFLLSASYYRILNTNGNIWFSFKDFENDHNIENIISFRSSFESEIVSNLTTASEI